MASNSIGGLKYQVNANVGGFQKGMMLSRSEMNMTRREMRKSRTDAEQFQQKLDTLERAFQAGAIELDEYHRTVVRLNSETPEAKAAAQEQARLREEAAQVTRRLMTQEERLAEQRERLNQLRPHLSEQAYARAIADVNAQTPQAVRQAERLSRRQELLNREMEEGRRITDRNETATESYQRELARLNKLLRRGALDQRTYRREADRLGQELRESKLQMVGQLPVMGQFTGFFAGMSPQLAAAGIAIAGATAGMYAFGRAVSHVTSRIREQMEEIDEQTTRAQRLGMAGEELAALRLAGERVAGLDFSTVDDSIQGMAERVAEAAQGTGEALEILDQLKLDPKALAAQNPADMFLEIADAVQDLKNPNNQLLASIKLFESEGAGMVTLLRQGAEGMERWERHADALNMAISDADAASIIAANNAISDLMSTVDGVYNKIAIELSPEIQVTTGYIRTLARVGTLGLGRMLDIGKEAARVYLNMRDAAYGFVTLDWDQMWAGLSGEGLGTSLMEGADAAEKRNREAAKELKARREESRRAAQIESANEDAAATQDQAASEFERQIQRERDKLIALKRGEAWLERHQWRQQGITEQQIREVRLLRQKTAELEKQKKAAQEEAKRREEIAKARQQEMDQLFARGEQLAQSHRTPFEQLVDELADARVLLRHGAIDARTASREVQAARSRFRNASQQDTPRTAPVITRGSREAYNEMVKAITGQRDKEAANQREQLAAQQSIQEATQRMAELMENFEPVEGE